MHLLDHYSYFSRMSEPGKDVNISALLNSFQMGYDKRVRPNYGGKTNFPILYPTSDPLSNCSARRCGAQRLVSETPLQGTRLQRRGPRCQAPVKAVRGVTGAAREQMMTSASAMLQMYMLDLVCSILLLCRIMIQVGASHSGLNT